MSKGHVFHPTVLRQYDIRGVVGQTLSAADARAIGRGFATMVRERGGGAVCVGHDGRLSAPGLEAALTEGLLAAGVPVLRVGLGPTPMLYFATVTLQAAGGVMVTGSHNPPDHNGFKFVLGGAAFYGREILRLGEIAAAGAWAAGSAEATERPMLDAYVARLVQDYDGERPLTVAWDAGNGAAGEAMARLVAGLPGRHVLLNQVVDGRFPAHHPDPTVSENLEQLRQAVAREGCDLGVAFDGDGDRIGVVDGRGRILWGDQLMVLLARDVLQAHPGATIIADVKASQVLFDSIAEMGGVPLMWHTGHSLIKAKMAELGAPLAGEMSGHIFFADRYYGYDDALYAALRLIGLVARSDSSLAQMRDALPQPVNTPELRFACDDERKFAVVDEVRWRLEEAAREVSTIDGVRVRTADGWWLLRASNTEPALVARCEAGDVAGLDRLKAELSDQLRESGVGVPDFVAAQ
ncbi:MAG: phosphoglucomutase/phosphomannomutase PgmG [Kiloniellales bacterium]